MLDRHSQLFSHRSQSSSTHTKSRVHCSATTVHGAVPPSKRRRFDYYSAIKFTMSSQDSPAFNWHYDTELDDQTLQIRGRKLFFIIVLFSIVLLFTALFLFARRICRHHGLLPTTFDSIQPLHAPSLSPPQHGLDADTIKKLPIILHQTPPGPNRALEETECCICLSAFVDGEKLKVLPGCDHSFHCECVDKWLANHSNCPLCRASLELDSSFPRILIQEPPVRHNTPF
ncbi:hypothetical protein VNO77_30207 [Canavalia gladiata]|uniref:RING-type E3 ubiquitin transferase n=1 Tax=Canavalia gladiata TaxID=3824 RepID=A0AAN9KQM0_CANGL